jgi:hypothetical protein
MPDVFSDARNEGRRQSKGLQRGRRRREIRKDDQKQCGEIFTKSIAHRHEYCSLTVVAVEEGVSDVVRRRPHVNNTVQQEFQRSKQNKNVCKSD